MAGAPSRRPRPRRRGEITEVLRSRILSGLHVGSLAGGERLPGARALAAEFGVNERMVLAALRTLAEEGFIQLRSRSGAYVTPPRSLGERVLPDVGAWIVGMLVQARSRGLAPREIPIYLQRVLDTRRIRAACIECNADQLDLLCSELKSDFGYETRGVMTDGMERSDAVLHSDVLVTTVFHSTEVQALARRLGKPCVVVTLNPNLIKEIGERLRSGPLYYVATDTRFERKLRNMMEGLGPLSNLRVVLVGRDDLDAIPRDAPTFVMSSAREKVVERYGPTGGPGRPMHPPRLFSDESARDLLALMVRANTVALAAGLR